MNRIYYLVIFLAANVLAAAGSTGSASAQTIYPSGIAGASGIAGGIYAGTDAGNCCWMGAQAAIRTSVPSGADTLLLNVFIPDFAASKGDQTLRVRIGGAPVQERCCLGAGEHELAFALPARPARSRTTLVELRANHTFVPKEIGLNEDPRHLSVLVRGIAFLNARTGERFDTATLTGPQPRVTLALLLLAGILALVLTLRRPVYGVVALLLTGPFHIAYAVHGVSVTLPEMALVGVAAGLIPQLTRFLRDRPGTAFRLLFGAQAFFVLTMLAASPRAMFHAAAFRETLIALAYAALLVILYRAYRLDPDERCVRWAFIAITIAVTALAIGQEFGGAPQGETIVGETVARIAGPLGGPNQLAGFLGVVIPAMLAFAVLRRPIFIEWVAIALGSLACILTFSRSGIAALGIGVVVLLAIRYAPQRRRVIAACTSVPFVALLVLAFGIFTGTVHGRAQNLFGSTGGDSFNGGLGSRVDLWHAAYALWRSHPLFGIGPGNFEIAVGRYDPGVRTHANSMWFQVLAEQGIAGLIALLAIVAASIGVFLRRLNAPLPLGASIAAIVMAFHQIVDCMWIYPRVGIIWWALLALGAAAVDRPSTASDQNRFQRY